MIKKIPLNQQFISFKINTSLIRIQFFIILFLISNMANAQAISQYTSFHGSYDFTMIGNTLNLMANGAASSCTILSSSSANLNLQAGQEIEAAYLYWSGSGTLAQGDFNVKLNNIDIEAERTFTTTFGTSTTTYAFGAFANVTEMVQSTGNGNYTFSDLDLNQVVNLPMYCSVGLNYAGWAILIVYKDTTLPNNIVTIYDGFESVSTINPSISITLSGLNVVNTSNAKLGFLAWEGDENIAVAEQLFINSTLVSNPPLNPASNVFNCTNSFTNAANLWNMDLDYFDISSIVNVGDTSLNFSINSGQDTVITNCFAVSLNSELSDATIVIDEIRLTCDSRMIEVDYTISNLNEYINLPNHIPITFYADSTILSTIYTNAAINVSSSFSSTVSLNVPSQSGLSFLLKASVDDSGNGLGIVTETDEDNNVDFREVEMKISPKIGALNDLISCDDDEDNRIAFDLTVNEDALLSNTNVTISYYLSENDALNEVNSITNAGNYDIETLSEKDIWMRFQSTVSECYTIDHFSIKAQRKALANIEQPIVICNDKDNVSFVNLELVRNYLSREYTNLNNLLLSYYPTFDDAYNETNQIISLMYQPDFLPTKIYLRAKGNSELWCDKILEVQLNDCKIPKGISSNGDGLNDFLNLEGFNILSLEIMNRYGSVVYKHGLGYSNQWYGQDQQGRVLPAGTYFYTFHTLFETYTGYIYVIREVK